MTKQVLKALDILGFRGNEATTYLTLLQLGKTTAGNIAQEAGLDRSSTYQALNQLLERGVISYTIRKGVREYQINSPEDLLGFVREKERVVESILPELQKTHTKPQEEVQITHYKGYNGIRSIFEDKIREQSLIRVLDSEGQFSERMDWYVERFKKQVAENNIPIHHIARKGVHIKGTSTTTAKYVDKQYTESAQGVIDVYADKVSIILWTDKPEAVLIQNKWLAESLKDYFDIIWKQAE